MSVEKHISKSPPAVGKHGYWKTISGMHGLVYALETGFDFSETENQVTVRLQIFAKFEIK